MSSQILAFATVFLSLTVGVQPVDLMVSGTVSRVELILDGELIAELDSPPWRVECDFGQSLEPHRLEAVAYDGEDAEAARVVQWVNLSTAPAEASIVIERPAGEPPYARLSWANLFGDAPQSISLTMDGAPLEITDPSRIPLPPHDLDDLHFLRTEIDFADNISTVVEAVFGGSYGDQVSAMLTALPITLHGRSKLPDIERLQDWFLSDGQPVQVAAIDKGEAKIVFIRDRAAQPSLESLLEKPRAGGQRMWLRDSKDAARFVDQLKKDQVFGFFWPFLETARPGLTLFPRTYGWLSPRDGGVGWLLARVPPPPYESEQMLADAVAVGGMSSLARNRRRAVVLILGDSPEDESRIAPAEARAYLQRIRVPLFVWSPLPQAGNSPWGEITDISTPGKLASAVAELSEAVDRQRIVWLEGRHLPQQIELTSRAVSVGFSE